MNATTYQQHARIGEARVRLHWCDRTGENDSAHGEHRGREERERTNKHRRDGRGENREQVPGRSRESGRDRPEPDSDRDYEGHRLLEIQS
jgi:hypothetical protein